MAKDDTVVIDGVTLTRDQVERATKALPEEPPVPTIVPGTIVGFMGKRGPAAVGLVIQGLADTPLDMVSVTSGLVIDTWPAAEVQTLGHISDFLPQVEMKH